LVIEFLIVSAAFFVVLGRVLGCLDSGIPHGPHPGAVEKSIGAKETKELAVMIDTFRPLQLTQTALDIENQNYVMSWAE